MGTEYHSAVTLLGTPSICPDQGLTPLDRVLVQVVEVVVVGLALQGLVGVGFYNSAGNKWICYPTVSGVNKKQETSLFFPRQKFCNPCISRSNIAPTPLINQFLLVFKQQMFEVTKKNTEKNK